MSNGPPSVARRRRANGRKATYAHRVVRRSGSVGEEAPGVTRDRVAYDANWAGRSFTLVDTGGWQRDVRGMAARIAEQAEVAVAAADVVLVVIDATVGITEADEQIARVLQRSGKPIVFAANKVDNAKSEADVAELWSLGLGEPMPVSALH